jgi:hypothetical protein
VVAAGTHHFANQAIRHHPTQIGENEHHHEWHAVEQFGLAAAGIRTSSHLISDAKGNCCLLSFGAEECISQIHKLE